ncbi:MAG: efflux RND transporter periplasmic adaptor subunit [Planctomycetes bacterium]|nr:efflux RND transporter periplasmic adaptor subunit [Planctomycetota bacterium]
MKKLKLLIIIVVIAFLSWAGLKLFRKDAGSTSFRTATVEKGNVIQTVGATGEVKPLKQVQVGTQVTGPILKLYADYNSKVTEGQIVAQIDPAVYETKVAQSKANLIRSEADVERVRASLLQAQNELTRSKKLAERDLISTSELDAAIANYDSISAQLKVSLASVDQSRSALQSSEVDLAYTTIKSPVDGIVISRNVDEGQMVVGSTSAQMIFIIATDLKQIQIQANIPESDIGQIKERQPVKFTVDAYPDIEFFGVVTQVRLSATSVSNVVTYTVIISAENPDEKLFPGMTANLTIEVERRMDVFKVPNSALRFIPDESLVAETDSISKTAEAEFPALPGERGPSSISGTDSSRTRSSMRRERPGFSSDHGPGRRSSMSKTGMQKSKLWVLTDKKLLKSIPIITGISDGSFTEIIKGEVSDGMEIVTGITDTTETTTKTNPFMPSPGRRR